MKSIVLFFLSLVLVGANGQPDSSADGHIQPWPENPHYLAWGDTPVFPLGATGYHSWTPVSRPAPLILMNSLNDWLT